MLRFMLIIGVQTHILKHVNKPLGLVRNGICQHTKGAVEHCNVLVAVGPFLLRPEMKLK